MDELLTIGVDYGETVRMFEAFGFGAKAHVRAAAFITANAVKALAQSTMQRGRPFTFTNVAIEPRRVIDGYVVLMNRSVKDFGGERGARLATTPSGKRGEKHVGKWLEFGTVHMRSRAWLFPSAQAQESAYLQRVIEAVDRARVEAGG
jgi:hypothetical protein